MNEKCVICNKEVELEYCCNGEMCGCQGLPINLPLVCSDQKCIDKWNAKYIEDFEFAKRWSNDNE